MFRVLLSFVEISVPCILEFKSWGVGILLSLFRVQGSLSVELSVWGYWGLGNGVSGSIVSFFRVQGCYLAGLGV